MLLFSSKGSIKLQPAINLAKIGPDIKNTINLIAGWFHCKWGYLRPSLSLSERKKEIFASADKYYIIRYGECVVAVFRLLPTKKDDKALEILSLYVDERMRSFGVGSHLLSEAKRICREQGFERIILQTLTPRLNGFYLHNQADLLGESYFKPHVPSTDDVHKVQKVLHPCDELQIRLKP